MYVALWHGGRRSRRATKYDDEAYGGHELLLDANVLLWTNKRLMLINIPGVAEWLRHVAAGSSPAHIPDLTLIWDIEWNNLLAINLLRAMQGDSTPALLVYSRAKQITFPNFLRAIRCPANEIWMLRQKIWETHQRYVVFSPRMLAYTRSVSCNNIAGSSSPPALLSADFRWMWRSEGKGRAVSVWRPLGPPGYVALGDVAVIGSADPSSPVAMLLDDSNTATADGRRSRVAAPLGFHIIFRSTHHSLTVWEPIPPDGYCAMGCMVVSGIETPPIGIVRCLRRDLVMCTQFFDAALWKGQSSDIDTMVSSFWLKDQNPLSTFWAVRGVDRPHSSLSLVPKPEAVRSDAC
ncbi:unnamed protein product [Ostreobium quekettii]|uniref:Uncharacterized protein n=1 Tax=Ostreobium quekettii TaxID=121088 RepID=A0A8S1J105_9CHLO|nr:unnamed protein product [Ostreobium quekettii]